MAKPFPCYPELPVITSHNSTFSISVDENATNVASLTYTPANAVLSLSGSDAGLFSINLGQSDAQLVFSTAPDYETPGDVGGNNVYNVTVTATYLNRTDTCDFIITVVNVDEGTPGGDVTAPTLSSATINAAGTTLTVVWSENVTNSSGLILTPSGSSASLIYASGSGTSTYTYTISRPILDEETVTIGATSSNIVDGATNTLANFSGTAVTNNSTQVAGSGESLRPAIFPTIPSEAASAGFTQNDLSTSVRTNVASTARAGIISIAAGTYTSPYTASTSDREYRLAGNVVFDGAGIYINTTNVTINLNGYTLTYMNVDLEDEQVGTVATKSGGDGTTRPSMTVTGVTNSGLVIEFLDGAEAGNWYEVYSGSAATTLTLENTTISTDEQSTIRRWEDGGPTAGDTFRIFDPRKTFGIGTLNAVYNKTGVEIVNGYIVQGAAAADGRGYTLLYNVGCAPICSVSGADNWMIGGVDMTWSSANTDGIWKKNSYGTLVVKYCELDDQGTFVSNRQRPVGAISVGRGTIQYNRIINHRHLGVELGLYSSTVEYNEIYGDSRATNAGGVSLFGTDNTTVRYNNIYKTGEHPMCIAVHDAANNNSVYGNWCEAKATRTSSEYPWNYAVGLSNRWAYSGYRTVANNFDDNCFITYSEDGPGVGEISRAKTMFFGALQYTAGENVTDCFIGAYNTDDATECHCLGLSVHNDDVVFRGCTFAGSHNIFWIGDNYGNGTTGGRVIDCTITKIGSDAGFKTFMSNGYFTSNADFISNTYGTGTGTAAADIGVDAQGFGSPDSGNIFRFGFNLTVTVTNGGSPVSGATVTVKDVSNNTIRSGYITDVDGEVIIDVPTFYRQGPALGSTSLNALTVSAVSSSLTGSNTISPTSDDSVTVTIA
jgi:hypothetical protein